VFVRHDGEVSGAGIFLIRGGDLVVLDRRAYDSEDLLQAALAEFPAVLAGGTTAAGDSPRLLLVRREMGVPSAEGGSATWSLDHRFVDSEGVPVVVEVKRSTDTRIRREVVGQMLDYAANGVRYWPVADLRAAFEASDEAMGSSGDELLAEMVPDTDSETFWQRVGANLAAGRIRLVFVADVLPAELIRIIEFLNEQMSPAEVLGVEVQQYVGSGEQVLVPRVVGRTSDAVAAKQTAAGRAWDEEGFLSETDSRHGESVTSTFRRLFAHADRHGELRWGKGNSPGVSAWYRFDTGLVPCWAAFAGTIGDAPRPYVSFYLPDIRTRLPDPAVFDRFVDSLSVLQPLRQKLEDARREGFERRNPSLFLTDLRSPSEVDALFAALDRLVLTP
jgi:hypothetical protein